MNLDKNKRKYCNLIHLKSDPMVSNLLETETSIVLYKRDMECYFIACERMSEVDQILAVIDTSKNNGFCINTKELRPYLPGMEDAFECWNYLYEKDSIDFEVRDDVEIRELDDSYYDFVLEHYHGYDDPNYIQSRLASGNLWGVFKEDVCMGFIGYHDEGSMGLLVILDQYKRLGLGTYMEKYLIDKTLKQGRLPFAQVHPDNVASKNLQEKLGLKEDQNIVTWGNG